MFYGSCSKFGNGVGVVLLSPGQKNLFSPSNSTLSAPTTLLSMRHYCWV